MPSTPKTPGFDLALIQLPGRLRRALETFRRISGHTAVTSLATQPPEPGKPVVLAPPVHPQCARRLRQVHSAPCASEWLIHLRKSRRSLQAVSHVCPIGLRCCCVPVRFDSRLVGVAKLVVDSKMSDAAFAGTTDMLRLVVSATCQDSLVSVLSHQVASLRQTVAELQQIRSKVETPDDAPGGCSAARVAASRDARSTPLVERALSYLHRNYREPTLSLRSVAGHLDCNPTYLTSCFTRVVGEHMHRYLIGLRVAQACRLLLSTNLSIKETAYASGFLAPASLARLFRRQVGVSPREYRRIFSTP